MPNLDSPTRPTLLLSYGGAIAAVGLLLVGAAVARGPRAIWAALLVPLGLAVTAFGVLEPDWMGQARFATPVWALGGLAGAAALAAVLPHFVGRARVVIVATAAGAAVASGAQFTYHAREFRAAPTVPVCLVAQLMGWSFNG